MSRPPLRALDKESDSRLRRQLEITLLDEQHEYPIAVDRWLQLATDVLVAERVGERVDVGVEVSILFVDQGTISDLNQRFMGKEGPTDVLSFPIDTELGSTPRAPGPGDLDEDGFPVLDERTEVDTRGRRDSRFDDVGPDDDAPLILGDIVICPAYAARTAPTRMSPNHDGSLDDELALLLVHGILHLLGMDHMVDAEAEEMESREAYHLSHHYKRAGVPSTDPSDREK